MKYYSLACLTLLAVPFCFGSDYTREQKEHWAFQPLLVAEALEAELSNNRANQIDYILENARSQIGVTKNPEADRTTIVRRVYMDLIGLPPTPEEVQAFVEDPNPNAYESLVNQLLKSPHYGERWGRHWLDVARYGDSNGYRYDDDQPTAYHYRDFVIQAFNQDMPYDQFVQWQLAGNEIDPDNIDAITANGFLAVGPLERKEGSPDGVKLARYNELDDMIGATSSSMLGLTMSCARCHDHKFDPLTTKEYYQFAYIFNTGQRDVREMKRPLEESQKSAYREWLAENKKIKSDLLAWDKEHAEIIKPVRDSYSEKFEALRNKAYNQFLEKRPGATVDDFKKVNLDRPAVGTKYLSKKEFNEYKKSRTALRQLDTTHAQYFPTKLKEIKNKVSDKSQKALSTIKARRVISDRIGFNNQNKVLTYTDQSATPEPTHVLNRGLVTQIGEPVDLGFIDVLTREGYMPPSPKSDTNTQSTFNRTALAHWITDPDRGAGHLLARVMVNRIWLYHFGEGIVRTPNDFGTQGDIPARQDLLDYLAKDFIDSGWQIKRMHRLIMSSATYKQTTDFDKEREALDPENRSWWRRRAIRISSEALRDSILAVSGQLNKEQFGTGSYLPIPQEAVITRSAVPYPQGIPDDKQAKRRSVYSYIKRTVPAPILQLFDGADSSVSCGKRITTTVPTQALLLMNNEQILARSKDFAQRLENEAAGSFEQQLQLASQLALSRELEPEERKLFTEFYENQIVLRDGNTKLALTDLCQVIFNLNEFIYVN